MKIGAEILLHNVELHADFNKTSLKHVSYIVILLCKFILSQILKSVFSECVFSLCGDVFPP